MATKRVWVWRLTLGALTIQDHFLTGSKMLMIVAVNPHPGDFDEARQALQYGAIAKEVSTVAPEAHSMLLRKTSASLSS